MRVVGLAILLFGLSSCRVVEGGVSVATVSVFLSPHGADAADGRTTKTAVKSLQRALEIGVEAARAGAKQIAIEVGKGVYKGERATLAGTPEGVKIVIRPNPAGAHALFDGGDEGGVWLIVRPPAVGSRLSITDLEISNYITAISLNGSRDDPSQSIEGVEIIGNQFSRIGQASFPKARPSTAVVRLVNADQTRIIGNRFVDMRNVKECRSLHAIYLAHDSSENVIEANRFENGCGDAIRLRDKSNYNLIRDNTFIDAWASAPISDWYCNASVRKDCTKRTAECPSVGNVLEGNRIVARKHRRVDLVKSYERPPTSHCSPESAPKFFVK